MRRQRQEKTIQALGRFSIQSEPLAASDMRVAESVTALLVASTLVEARNLFGGGSLSEASAVGHGDRRRFSLPGHAPRPRWRDAAVATAFVHPGRRQRRQQQQQQQQQQRPKDQQQQQHDPHDRQHKQQQSGMTRYFSMVALCGAISCSVTHSLVLPLDVIKTTMQMDPSLKGPRQAAAAVMGDCRGPLCVGAFFNGLGATAIGYVLQGAFKFGAHDAIEPAHTHASIAHRRRALVARAMMLGRCGAKRRVQRI